MRRENEGLRAPPRGVNLDNLKMALPLRLGRCPESLVLSECPKMHFRQAGFKMPAWHQSRDMAWVDKSTSLELRRELQAGRRSEVTRML